MPQLDTVSFFPQFFWFLLIILVFYFQISKYYLPALNKNSIVREFANPKSTTEKQFTNVLLLTKFKWRLFIRGVLHSGAKIKSLIHLISTKSGIEVVVSQTRAQEVDQAAWKNSWFSSFLATMRGEITSAGTTTLSFINTAASAQLAGILLARMTPKNNYFKKDNLAQRFIILFVLKQLKMSLPKALASKGSQLDEKKVEKAPKGKGSKASAPKASAPKALKAPKAPKAPKPTPKPAPASQKPPKGKAKGKGA